MHPEHSILSLAILWNVIAAFASFAADELSFILTVLRRVCFKVNMAAVLKKIGSRSTDTLSVAIRNVLSDEGSRQQFETTLKKIDAVLGDVEENEKTKQKKSFGVPSDVKLFKEKIIPQIRDAVDKYKKAEDDNKLEEFSICRPDLRFLHKFNEGKSIDLQLIKRTHLEIIKQEQVVKNYELVLAYHRGLLYARARELIPEGDSSIREWFGKELEVAYCIVQRYLMFTVLIQPYPRLIACSLSFSQLSKHQNRLFKYLGEEDTELGHKLKAHVNLVYDSVAIGIQPAEFHSIPKMAISLINDPDHVYESEDWYGPQTSDEGAQLFTLLTEEEERKNNSERDFMLFESIKLN